MARNFFEEVKRIIDERTNKPEGLVANLHGIIDESLTPSAAKSNQTWYAIQAEVKKHPTLREFIDAFTHQRLPVAEISSLNGASVFPETGQIKSGVAIMLYTSINLSSPDAIPIHVTAPGHAISVYVDDVVQAQGVGGLDGTLAFATGQHFIAVVCFGSQNAVEVDIDEKYALTRGEPTPPAPHLAGLPVATYLAAKNGSFIVDVKWHNDSYASAWQVYRAQATPLGAILAITPINPARSTVRVAGTFSAAVGLQLFTSKFFVGYVSAVSTGTYNGNPVTDFDVTLDHGAPADAAQWVGNTLLLESTSYSSIARVTYSGDAVIDYQDLTVKQGGVYLYRVTAFGFIVGVAESDYSEIGWVLVDDTTPPGDITFDANTDVRIVNGEIQLGFLAPSDADYHGVKVYVENATDATKQDLVNTEFGIPAERDQVSWRPPRQGNYWLRTFDWAGNIQPIGSGKKLVYDGNSRWSRAVSGILVGTVNGLTLSLALTVQGIPELFPATVTFYRDGVEDSNRIDLDGRGTFSTTLSAPGTVGSGAFAGLTNIAMPPSGLVHFWARITDKDGNDTWADTQDDLGINPDGVVVLDDELPFPSIAMLYDQNVDSIVVTIPDPQHGGVLGTRTYTRTSGLQASGGGEVIYTVGGPIVLGTGLPGSEAPFLTDGVRDGYKVEFKHGSTTKLIWQGKLHGTSSKAPAIQVRYQLDPVTKDVANVFVKVMSVTGEPCTLELLDDDDLSLPVWQYVTGNNDATLRYLDDGATTSFADWWRSDVDGSGPVPPVWKQKLSAVPLHPGQTKQILVRAITRDSGIASSWIHVAMPLKEVPEISNVDLSFNELTKTLNLTGTGGVHCQSARFEFSTDKTFATVAFAQEIALLSQQVVTVSKNVVAADRNQMWYGRVIPFNGPMSAATVPTVTGLGGIPHFASIFVPDIAGNAPAGAVKFSTDYTGTTVLIVTPTNNTLSFGYTLNDTAFDLTGARTSVNFVSGAPYSVPVGQLTSGQTKFAVVWFYEQTGSTGNVSKPFTDSIKYSAPVTPKFDYVVQTRTSADTDPAILVDFQIMILDPQNSAGTFKAWVNKTGTSSAIPTGPADFTFPVTTTPFEVNMVNFPAALHNVVGNAKSPKTVYFEFINATGQSTGKKDVVVTSDIVAFDPSGSLKPGIVQINNLATNMKPIVVVSTLPGTAAEGDVVYLTTDSQLYKYHNGVWGRMIAGNAVGQIDETVIKDNALSVAKFALGLRPVRTLSALPAAGDVVGDIVYLTTTGKMYRWNGSSWDTSVQAADINGQLINAQIADAALSVAKFAAGIRPVETFGSLPGVGVTGQVVLLTTDSKLYRWTGSAWTAATAASDIAGQLVGTQIQAQSITSTQISDGAITTPKIVANAITANQLAAGSVVAGKLAAGAVVAGTIAAGAITAGTLAADAITAGTIAAGAITAREVVAGSLSADRLAARSITATQIAASTITANEIAVATITANNIAANSITADRLVAHSITAGQIAAGAITATEIAASAINAQKIAVGTITGDKLAFRTLQATNIASGTLTANEIAFNSITGDRLVANTITAGQIRAGAISGNEIAANTLTAHHIQTATLDITTMLKVNRISDISANGGLGIITDAVLRNASATRYLNLNADGSGTYANFLNHEQFKLTYNGTCIFNGQINLDATSSAYGWSNINFNSSGGQWGQLHTFYGSASNCGVELDIFGGGSLFLSLDGFGTEVRTANANLRADQSLIIGSRNVTPWYVLTSDQPIGRQSGDTGYNIHWLSFEWGGGSRIRFKPDGKIEASNFYVYSPEPPKPAHAMTAKDWIVWGAEDARKPVWQHKEGGLPNAAHPEIVRLATEQDRDPALVSMEAEEMHQKDVSKIAIGTANWAHLVMMAIEEASDFADFKHRLGL